MPSPYRLAIPCLVSLMCLAQPVLAESQIDVGYARLDLQEHYTEGGSETSVPGNDVFRLAWRQDWNETWGTTLHLQRWGTYLLEDGLVPGSTHARTETWASLTADRKLDYWATHHHLSVGYQGRMVQVVNSFAAPTPLYLFSERQVFHGPFVGDRISLPLLGKALSLFADVSASPYTFSALDPGVQTLGSMFWFAGDLGLELTMGRAVGRLSYRYETLRRFDGQFQDISGPALALGHRF